MLNTCVASKGRSVANKLIWTEPKRHICMKSVLGFYGGGKWGVWQLICVNIRCSHRHQFCKPSFLRGKWFVQIWLAVSLNNYVSGSFLSLRLFGIWNPNYCVFRFESKSKVCWVWDVVVIMSFGNMFRYLKCAKNAQVKERNETVVDCSF